MTTELPDDIEKLKKILAKLQHDNNALHSEVKTLNSKNKNLENSLDIAWEQLKLNRKKQFGQHSEKCRKARSMKLKNINPPK